MELSAIILILIAAIIHASWNFVAKRSGGGTTFVWLFAVGSVLIYSPIAIYLLYQHFSQLSWLSLLFLIGSGVLHTIYFLLLDKGYRQGDLSLVYPLARGSGPLFTVFFAILILNEHPSFIAIAGTIAVVSGIIILSAPQKHTTNRRKALYSCLIAITCGLSIASYSLWDKYAVSTIILPPLLLDWSANFCRAIILAGGQLGQRERIKKEWQINKKNILVVATLTPLSYIFVLTAMQTSPVSYVAPLREISILIASLLGMKFLHENFGLRRLLAAILMLIGLFSIAIN